VDLVTCLVTRLTAPTAVGPSVLDVVGIRGRASAYPRQLSGGEAARASLAVALANDPSLLIADEPTGDLDEDTEHRILDLLRARADDGRAVLVASHSATVPPIADRVLTLSDGRLR
jgi:putative ABC transport system ATP-binding protein